MQAEVCAGRNFRVKPSAKPKAKAKPMAARPAAGSDALPVGDRPHEDEEDADLEPGFDLEEVLGEIMMAEGVDDECAEPAGDLADFEEVGGIDIDADGHERPAEDLGHEMPTGLVEEPAEHQPELDEDASASVLEKLGSVAKANLLEVLDLEERCRAAVRCSPIHDKDH